jgi:glycosyltransferase involved in cell wall biosynthesis
VQRYGAALGWEQLAHGGVGAARNVAVPRMRGDLVAFLDADDWWTPDKLAVQVAAFQTDPAPDAVFGHVQQVLNPGLDPALAANVWAPEHPVPGRIATTLLITPAAWARVGGFTVGLRITEFLDWYARALEAGLRMPMLPNLMAYRRIHGANQSLRDSVDRLEYPRVIQAALKRRRAAGG